MSKPDLASLVGARICHDLISPIGAIGNGVELLSLSGPPSAELRLIADSVAGASAKVKFLRVAFGRADTDQSISADDVKSVLREAEASGRVSYDWQVTTPAIRAEVRCAFLAVLCLQTAMPQGGTITVSASGGVWHLFGRTPTPMIDPTLWAGLQGGGVSDSLSPNTVHFGLLPEAARAIGRTAQGAAQQDGIAITF